MQSLFYNNELYERRMCVDTESYLKSTPKVGCVGSP